jgi:hypothetical protein
MKEGVVTPNRRFSLKRTFSGTVLIATVIVVSAAGALVLQGANAETSSTGAIASLVQDASPSAGETASVTGKWLLSWQGKKRSRPATFQIQQDGSKLTGTCEARDGSESLSGSLQGDQVSISVGGRKRTITFTGTVQGNRMSGTTNTGSSWTATRQ